MTGPHHCIGDCQRSEAEIARLRSLLDDATYRAEHYMREACQLADTDRANAIQAALGLTSEESVVCTALYQRREKLLPGGTIEGLLDEFRGGPTEASLVSQMVSRIRRKLGESAVENQRGRGYRLSPALLARLDRVLA